MRQKYIVHVILLYNHNVGYKRKKFLQLLFFFALLYRDQCYELAVRMCCFFSLICSEV